MYTVADISWINQKRVLALLVLRSDNNARSYRNVDTALKATTNAKPSAQGANSEGLYKRVKKGSVKRERNCVLAVPIPALKNNLNFKGLIIHLIL